MVQKILLSCGILAPLIYLGTDWLAGKLLKGYSFIAQSMSELSAAGSPTRSRVVWLTLLAGAVMIAFGVGVLARGGSGAARTCRQRSRDRECGHRLDRDDLFPEKFWGETELRQPRCAIHVLQRALFCAGNGVGSLRVQRLAAHSIHCHTGGLHPAGHLEVRHGFHTCRGNRCICHRSTGTEHGL